MAPARPKSYTAGSNPVSKLEGAYVVTIRGPPKGRNIHYHVRVDPNHPRLLEMQREGKKPPTHFHPHQWEFFRVETGSLTVEINGVPHKFVASDGEYALPPGPHHCLYATADQEPGTIVQFWLGASPSGADSELDQAFFENWYGYWEDVMLRGVKADPIQVLTMFDAGGSYISPPAWVPFRRALGRLAGIVIGRWVGGLLGYSPYHPEWTTDWDAACARMKRHWTQRRFADRGLQAVRRAEFLTRGESVGNGGLYDEAGGYENWLNRE